MTANPEGESLLPFRTGFATRVIATDSQSITVQSAPAALQSVKTALSNRGIIPPLHELPPTGGSHGKLHRTTKIRSHARQRGCVAARGARAAGGETGDRSAGRPHTRTMAAVRD